MEENNYVLVYIKSLDNKKRYTGVNSEFSNNIPHLQSILLRIKYLQQLIRSK
jgi:hypothetical protein